MERKTIKRKRAQTAKTRKTKSKKSEIDINYSGNQEIEEKAIWEN